MRNFPALLPLVLVVACHQGGSSGGAGVPGDTSSTKPYDGIGADEVVHFVGTEPFWGGQADAKTLRYTTPGNPEGVKVPITRFTGRGGLGISGELDGHTLDMTVTPGQCTDGMSDRRFPFVATLKLKGEVREGCAWTDDKPFTGPANP